MYHIYITEDDIMDYKPLYLLLFNATTEALEQLDAQNYGDARDILIAAQQKAEEIYINSED